jgi:Mce-associated membrane protein
MSRRRPTRRTVLIAVAVLTVVFALASLLVVQRSQSSTSDRFDAPDAATGAAADAVPRMLGYGHATIADDLDDATEVMTKSFAKKYSELAPQLIATAEQRKIDVTATVRSIAALECGRECSTSRVRLLAFVDQHRTIAGKPGSPAALSVVISMHRVDGDWLVDDLSTS